jgi:hypothetical protein
LKYLTPENTVGTKKKYYFQNTFSQPNWKEFKICVMHNNADKNLNVGMRNNKMRKSNSNGN